MRSKLIFIVIIALVAALAVTGCSSIAPGGKAPDFTLKGLDGEEYSLSDYEGSPIVLNFFATWCGPCQLESPFFETAHASAKWQDEGVIFIAVDRGESADLVKQFKDYFGISFPILLDSNLDIFETYNVLSGIPVTFFIDKRGIIQEIKTGAFSSLAGLEASLDKLVGS